MLKHASGSRQTRLKQAVTLFTSPITTMAQPMNDGGSDSNQPTAEATHECVVCKSKVEKPYKTLLGGGIVCSMECYQRHLSKPDDDYDWESKYW